LAIAQNTAAIAAGRLVGCSLWLRLSEPGCWLSSDWLSTVFVRWCQVI